MGGMCTWRIPAQKYYNTVAGLHNKSTAKESQEEPWPCPPGATNVAADSHAAAGDSKASHAASRQSLGANMLSPASEKSWLDSRLERARTLPPPSVKQDTTSATKSQGPAANLMVELRVAQRSPKNSTESAACLRINASSTEALDKVLTESVGSLLSAMRPALS